LKVTIGKLNAATYQPNQDIQSVLQNLNRYVKRYLPAKGIGLVVISTSEGLMTHSTAQDKNIGGSLNAYLY
jgi:ribosomal protein S8